jgi:hypothetical protein
MTLTNPRAHPAKEGDAETGMYLLKQKKEVMAQKAVRCLKKWQRSRFSLCSGEPTRFHAPLAPVPPDRQPREEEQAGRKVRRPRRAQRSEPLPPPPRLC